jgi:hypothetical protein
MELRQIEKEALQLSSAQRAMLAQKLLLSLDELSENEIHEEWLKEASNRAEQLDLGRVESVPADVVRAKAKSLLS